MTSSDNGLMNFDAMHQGPDGSDAPAASL
jgi:hypothetical protein